MTKFATKARATNAGATLAQCNTVASGRDGIKVWDNFSLPALLPFRLEGASAAHKAGGALMQIDDSTPEEASSVMARIKYMQECTTLKAKTMKDAMHEDNVAYTSLGQLRTAIPSG